MKERLLFVTKGNKDYDEGFHYVAELSKTLNSGIKILMVYDSPIMEMLEDDMAAVAFAEAGEFKAARSTLYERQQKIDEDARKKFSSLIGRYFYGQSVGIDYLAATGEVVSNIIKLIEGKPSIDMVLLSPSLSNKGAINIKKLLRNISRPIVTMARLTKTKA